MLKFTKAVCNRLIHNLQKFSHILWIATQLIGISIPLVQLYLKPDVFLYNAIIAGTLIAFFIFTLIVDRNKEKNAKKKAKKQKNTFKKITKIIKLISKLFILFTVGYGIYCTEPNPSFLTLLPIILTACGITVSIIISIISYVITVEVTLLVDAVQRDISFILNPIKNISNVIHRISGHLEEIDYEPLVSPQNMENLDRILMEYNAEQAQAKAKKKKEQQEYRNDFFRGLLGLLKKKKTTTEVPTPSEATIADALADALPAPETVEVVPAPIKKKKSLLAFLPKKKRKVAEEVHTEEQVPEEALPKV